MEESLALQVVRAFVARINAHNGDGLFEMMTEEHRLVDAAGVAHIGRGAARRAWNTYFALVPDYRVVCEHMIAEGTTVAIFGRAGGTFSIQEQAGATGHWDAPAAWKVIVHGTRVAEWRVYMDTSITREMMARMSVQ